MSQLFVVKPGYRPTPADPKDYLTRRAKAVMDADQSVDACYEHGDKIIVKESDGTRELLSVARSAHELARALEGLSALIVMKVDSLSARAATRSSPAQAAREIREYSGF